MLRRRRNTVAHWIANTALRLIATKDYRDMVAGSIRYGVNSAARDAEEGRESPQPWQVLASARSVGELRCECSNRDRDIYTGRDGRIHCGQCDGWLPDNYCTACGKPCAGESEA